jgi:hypothetical protein
MGLDLVAGLILGLAAGLVLGYWAAIPRVKRLEKELETVLRLEKANWLARDSRLAMAHSLEKLKAEESGLVQQELDLEKTHLSDLAMESARQEQEKRNWKVQG